MLTKVVILPSVFAESGPSAGMSLVALQDILRVGVAFVDSVDTVRRYGAAMEQWTPQHRANGIAALQQLARRGRLVTETVPDRSTSACVSCGALVPLATVVRAEFVLCGGEANEALVETFAKRLNLPGELGNPLRGYDRASIPGRNSQWDVAAGLALRQAE